MGKLSTIISVAALAGLGYYVGKKVFDKKKADEAIRAERIANGEIDESELFVEETHSSPKEKLQRASLFAVGAIKTGTEKFKEGIDEIINADMVSKGETTMTEVKEFAADKKEKTAAFVAEKKEQAGAFAAEKKEQAGELFNNAKEKTVNFATGAKENIKNEIDNLKNMVTSINANPGEAEEEIIDMADIAEDADADIPAEDIVVEEIIEEAEEVIEEIPSAEEIEEVKAEAAEAIAEYREEIAEATDEASEQLDQLNDTAEEIVEEAAEAVEEAKEEAEEVISSMEIDDVAFEEAEDDDSEDLDDISFDNMGTESVDTFDFGAADQL